MGKRGKGTRSGDAALLRQGKQSKSSRSKAEDYFNDEIDDFHEEREKVLLDGKGLYDDDEDEDEVSNEQRNVLALENDGLDAHFDEYGYEESEEDDVGEEDNDAEHSDSDSSEVRRKARQERYEERITQNWGKQKKSYYHTDYVDEEHSLSDEEVAKEEEEEVKRLEKKKQISKADFGVESDSEDDSASSSSSSQTSRKNKSKSQTTSDDDLALLRKVNESLDDVGFGDLLDTNVDVERVDRDLTHMSKKEKRKLIETDSPELLQLLDDFKEMIEELKERIEPTITKVRTGDLPTKGGISLLDVKFQLMLNYCTNVAFYLLLKAEGRRVTDHPVILQLVKTRTLLEKLRPLDKKLAYQINKMLKLSSAIGEGDDAVAEALANDPMSHRPRLEMFGDDTVKHTKTMDSRGAEPDESDDAQVQNGDAAYVPPRLSAVPYDGDAKSTSKRDYQRKRAANSRMAQFVVDEFGEEPEELRENAGGAYDAVGDDKTEADRLRYEEENFLRLMTNKKDRKKRKRNELKNELAALNEYADLGALDAIGDDFGSDDEAMLDDDDDDTATKAAASHGQRRSLSQLINSLEQSSKKFAGAHRASGDDDVPYAAAQPEQIPLAKKQQKRARYQEDDDEDDGDAPIDYNDAAFDEDNDVYAEAKALERAQLKANKSSKEQKAARKAARAKAKLEAKEAELEALPEDYKRKTNSRIERNRGLVRSRPAYQANPRVAMRRKHQDKVRRRRGAVPKSRTEDGPYGGEASGVKTNIKRSVPLTR